jgi:hypothetical protein
VQERTGEVADDRARGQKDCMERRGKMLRETDEGESERGERMYRETERDR